VKWIVEASDNNKWTLKTIIETIETHKFPALIYYVRRNAKILKIPPFGNE
jgi:hypothetical protein